MKSRIVVALAVTFLAVTSYSLLIAQQAPLPPFNNKIPELAQSRQLIVVTTQEWNLIPAKISFLERTTEQDPWREALPSCAAVVGKNGLAWGIGLHGGPPENSIRTKHEGDLCSPAGIFELDEALGYASLEAAAVITFPYQQITSTMEAVDDPDSRYYNRIVDTTTMNDKDWNGFETILRSDELYRWIIVVKHNWKPYPGYGSAIFLHLWRAAGQGTAGCTAMAPENMEGLVHWLDVTKHPLLIQLPAAEYERWKKQWNLP
jgi:L,D-peptidoglycan transpeptidase YkuD (ErfK/YbiS/YcfS/YnhG family)